MGTWSDLAQVQLAKTDQVFGPTVRFSDPAETLMPTNLLEKHSRLGEEALLKKMMPLLSFDLSVKRTWTGESCC